MLVHERRDQRVAVRGEAGRARDVLVGGRDRARSRIARMEHHRHRRGRVDGRRIDRGVGDGLRPPADHGTEVRVGTLGVTDDRGAEAGAPAARVQHLGSRRVGVGRAQRGGQVDARREHQIEREVVELGVVPRVGERGLAGLQRRDRRRLLGGAHRRGVEVDARRGRRPGERGVDGRVAALRLEHADHLRPEDVRRVEVGVDDGRERLRALRRLARRLQRERGVVHTVRLGLRGEVLLLDAARVAFDERGERVGGSGVGVARGLVRACRDRSTGPAGRA